MEKYYYLRLDVKFYKKEALNEAVHSNRYEDYEYEGKDNETICFEFKTARERNEFALEYFGIEFQTVEA